MIAAKKIINKNFGRKILTVLFLLLSFSSISNATYYVCPTDIDYGCVWWNPLTWPECWLKRLYDILSCSAYNFVIGLGELIMENPDVSRFKPAIDQIITILYTFYAISIFVTAIYIILISASPYNRSRAKSMLLRLLLGLVLISLSMEIYEVLLSLSGSITKWFLAESMLTKTGMETLKLIMIINFAFLIPLIFFITVTVLAWLTIFIRYLLVVIMAILFPIGIFLYSFELTRGMGIHIIRYALVAIFTQPVQALMFSLMIISLNNVGQAGGFWGYIIILLLAAASFALIALTPLIISGATKWLASYAAATVAAVGFSVAYRASPRLGSAMVFFGALGSGMGPEAFETAAASYVLGNRYFTLRRDARYFYGNYDRFREYVVRKYPALTGLSAQEGFMLKEFEHALKDAEIYYNDLKRMGKSKEWIKHRMKNAGYGWYLPREEIERPRISRITKVSLPAGVAMWVGRRMKPVGIKATALGVKAAGLPGARKVAPRLKPAAKIVPKGIRKKVVEGARLEVDRARIGRYRKRLGRVDKLKLGGRGDFREVLDKAKEILVEEMKNEGFTDSSIEMIGSDVETLRRRFNYTIDQINDPNMRDTLARELANYKIDRLWQYSVPGRPTRYTSPARAWTRRFFGNIEALDNFKKNLKGYLLYRSVVRDKNIPLSQRLKRRIVTMAGRKRSIDRDLVFKEIRKFVDEDLEIDGYKFYQRKNAIRNIGSIDGVRDYLRVELGKSEREIKKLEGRARMNLLEDKIIDAKRAQLLRSGISHHEVEKELEKLYERLYQIDKISEDDINKFRKYLKKEFNMSDSEIRTYESSIRDEELLREFKEIAKSEARQPYLREELDLEEKWVRRYNELYEKFRDEERASWGATTSLISSQATRDFSRVSSLYTELGHRADVAYAVSLSENLHARMLLEDYMGFGPRPSEFYVGLGPETRREWEMKMKEEDDEVWKEIMGEEG